VQRVFDALRRSADRDGRELVRELIRREQRAREAAVEAQEQGLEGDTEGSEELHAPGGTGAGRAPRAMSRKSLAPLLDALGREADASAVEAALRGLHGLARALSDLGPLQALQLPQQVHLAPTVGQALDGHAEFA